MDRGAWLVLVHGIPQSQTRLSTHVLLCHLCLETATSNSSGLRLKPNSSAWHLRLSLPGPNFPFQPPLLLLPRGTLLPGCPWVTAKLGNPQRLPQPHAFAPASLPFLLRAHLIYKGQRSWNSLYKASPSSPFTELRRILSRNSLA